MRLRLAIVIVVFSLGGCGGGQKTTDDLLFDVRGYQEGLRWRKYEDSAARLAPSAREDFLDKRDELDDELRVDDYEIMRVKMTDEGKKATVQVKITWHMDRVGVVKDTVVEQGWERHKVGWILVGEKRKRGAEMPGVEEPPQASNQTENDSEGESLGR
jgi:hypothetical protein